MYKVQLKFSAEYIGEIKGETSSIYNYRTKSDLVVVSAYRVYSQKLRGYIALIVWLRVSGAFSIIYS